MNLRCIYCQTPFTLGRLEKLAAIQKLQAEGLHHYDAICPRCRRANPVSIQRLEIFTPGWQEGLKTLEAEAAQVEKASAGVAASVAPAATAPAFAPVAPSKKRHGSKTDRKPAAPAMKEPPTARVTKHAAKPAAKKAAAKPAPKAKKPTAKAKPAVKKAAPRPKPAKAKAKPKAKAKKK